MIKPSDCNCEYPLMPHALSCPAGVRKVKAELTRNRRIDRLVQVRDGHTNALLFTVHPATGVLRVRRKGTDYEIRLQDLIAFGNTSQREIFRVQPSILYYETKGKD
jgi:hypothetical protein